LHSESQGARGRSGLFPLHDVRHHPGIAPRRTLRPCRATQQVTGCLDPLARAGKRKCANDSGAESTASEAGGARRDRTDDLMLAKHALSQLSYGPIGRRPMVYVGLKRRRSHPRSWLPRHQARRPFGLWFSWRLPSVGAQVSARARRARKAEWPPALMRGKPRSRT
jgi:hypothetical protein